ncbi:hypothetical protein ACFWZY_16975 [Streptomyces sp. NPDC058992]|uniref:hypothetical protein n=1 Tax=Streptomyces sp. NPDC058992 TaxID=3346688 RepID=UPI0036A32309
MSENASGPQVQQSPGDRKDLAAGGGSATTVAQTEPTIDPDDAVRLWADAKALFFARIFPKYGSPAWRDLEPDDPKRLAAALYAAEMWRKYGDEDALIAWFREASRPRPPMGEAIESARRAAAYRMPPPRQLRATPGWPPIRIPGGNGRYLTYTPERRAAA